MCWASPHVSIGLLYASDLSRKNLCLVLKMFAENREYSNNTLLFDIIILYTVLEQYNNTFIYKAPLSLRTVNLHIITSRLLCTSAACLSIP